MGEKLKNIPKRAKEFWGNYSIKQKSIMVSVVAIVIITFAILAIVLTKPKMVTLRTCQNTKEASEVNKILEDEGITSKVSNDALVISVNEKDLAKATLKLGENSLAADEPSNIDDVFANGFQDTEKDKEKRYTEFKKEQIKTALESMDAIKTADVQLDVTEEDGTIIAKDKESYISVVLGLDSELDVDKAEGLAKYLKTAVGNKTTNNVLILDAEGNVLFSGENDSEDGISSGTRNLAYQKALESKVAKGVQSVLLKSEVYDSAVVTPHLSVNFDSTNILDEKYTPADGQEQGLLGRESGYTSESVNSGDANVPGTDTNANDATTYQMPNGGETSATTEEYDRQYTPNKTTTTTILEKGKIDTAQSSLSIVLNRYQMYNEADLRESGQLKKGTSFAEFKQQNGDKVLEDADPSFVDLASKATGIDPENITVVAYTIPKFVEGSTGLITPTFIMQIIMAALILGLLIFVLIKSMKSAEVLETEPELSVDAMIAASKQQELEDIELDDKSEARKIIEKFVDENPEAAASLLRNWINDDWE